MRCAECEFSASFLQRRVMRHSYYAFSAHIFFVFAMFLVSWQVRHGLANRLCDAICFLVVYSCS
nr:MAG TPA: hypothetical protein [Caudoviricetes sp.]